MTSITTLPAPIHYTPLRNTLPLLQTEAVSLASHVTELATPLATIAARLRMLSDRVQRRFFTLLPEAHQLEDEEVIPPP